MKSYILGFFVLAVAVTAAAQQPTQQVVQDKLYFEAAASVTGHGPMMARFGGASAVVKGAPYSAEATTEMVQTLGDGNRISNKTSNKSYRDAEGRTRVEITPSAGGAWMPDLKQFSVTVIDDPVSGDHITLNNDNKQATRFSYKGASSAPAGTAGVAGRVHTMTMVMRDSLGPAMPDLPPAPMRTSESGHTSASYVHAGAEGVAMSGIVSSDVKVDVKKEPLGKRVIEGVECTGSKETATVPAGAVGNDRAIETVTERWYSPDLQLDVMTKSTDPRFGETTYRLGNIIRSDQPKSLFEVPADYKVEQPNMSFKVMSDVKP